MVGIVVACVHEAGALEWHGGRGVDGERERERAGRRSRAACPGVEGERERER